MPKKVLSEAETRKNIREIAAHLGCLGEINIIFDHYDKLLRPCTNPIEKQAIALEANEAIHFMLSNKPGYIMVGNKLIGKE